MCQYQTDSFAVADQPPTCRSSPFAAIPAASLASTRSSTLWVSRTGSGDFYVEKVARAGYEWTVQAEAEWLCRVGHRGGLFPAMWNFHSSGAYLVREYVPGRRLGDVCIEGSGLRTAVIAQFVGRIQDGLDALHEVGGVMCDLTPQNIIIRPDGRVTIIDLGLCTEAGVPVNGRGSLDYSAPEQFTRGDYTPDFKADYFSLAAVAVRLFEATRDDNWLKVEPLSFDRMIEMQSKSSVHVPPKAPVWLRYLVNGFGANRSEDRTGNPVELRGMLRAAAGRLPKGFDPMTVVLPRSGADELELSRIPIPEREFLADTLHELKDSESEVVVYTAA